MDKDLKSKDILIDNNYISEIVEAVLAKKEEEEANKYRKVIFVIKKLIKDAIIKGENICILYGCRIDIEDIQDELKAQFLDSNLHEENEEFFKKALKWAEEQGLFKIKYKMLTWTYTKPTFKYFAFGWDIGI